MESGLINPISQKGIETIWSICGWIFNEAHLNFYEDMDSEFYGLDT